MIANLNLHPAYKDSGVPWLSESHTAIVALEKETEGLLGEIMEEGKNETQ